MAEAGKLKGKARQELGTKRDVEIYRQPQTALFSTRFVGGGELPDCLKDSYYTSSGLAQKAIDDYFESKNSKK